MKNRKKRLILLFILYISVFSQAIELVNIQGNGIQLYAERIVPPMKKRFLLRILLLLLVYTAVFFIIVVIQFPKQGLFTRLIGNLTVTGQYKDGDASNLTLENRALSGKASVIFGGMEFCLGSGAEGSVLRFLDAEGTAEELLPDSIHSSGESAIFHFPGGAELSFASFAGRGNELRISCALPENITGVELPFRPLRRTVIGNSGDGKLSISADGVDYSFEPVSMDTTRFVLLLSAETPALSYKTAAEKQVISIDSFILNDAQNTLTYNAVVNNWYERSYALWTQLVRNQNDEELVSAFMAESLKRGRYNSAAAAVPIAFLNGNRRTYYSAVFFGRLADSSVLLEAADTAKVNRISRDIRVGNSLEFLKEEKALEFLTLTGNTELVNYAAGIARSFDELSITLELLPGILESYAAWKKYRPSSENPFERLIPAGLEVLPSALILAGDSSRVFACFEKKADLEFNLRLGKSLLFWADDKGDRNWAALARSLILSSLLQSEESLTSLVIIGDNGAITDDVSSPAVGANGLRQARFSRLLDDRNFPRAVSIETTPASIWAWTAASVTGVNREANVLNIAVDFPANETHYMILKGIPAFSKIQLYNIDYPSDPQFEGYNSSGWVYNAASGTLLVKMRHRNDTEFIRVYF